MIASIKRALGAVRGQSAVAGSSQLDSVRVKMLRDWHGRKKDRVYGVSSGVADVLTNRVRAAVVISDEDEQNERGSHG